MLSFICSFQVGPDRWMRYLGTCLAIFMLYILSMGTAIALDSIAPSPSINPNKELIGAEVGAELSGEKLFEIQCAGCHAGGGNIIRRGKNLKLKALQKNKVDTLEAVVALVTQGKGNMSAYADRITPEEIQTVSAYVLSQAQKNWK